MSYRAAAALSLSLLSGSVLADTDIQPATAPNPAAPATVGRQPGVELDLLLGVFIGARVKGIVYSANSFNLAIEGLAGYSFLGFDLFSARNTTTYGGGIRSEFVLASAGRHALMLSPGLDVYDLPSDGSAWLAPNVDLNGLYQISRHFGLVYGLKGGAAIDLRGSRTYPALTRGDTGADAELYIGARF
ncbi:MAG: hypothetical protein P4L83_00410 [Nevskia sp.]|nr:hypothetical protein [Nevskia sp.]